MDAMDAVYGASHAIVIIRFVFVAEVVPAAMDPTACAVRQDAVKEDAYAVKVGCYVFRVANVVIVHSRLVANAVQMAP